MGDYEEPKTIKKLTPEAFNENPIYEKMVELTDDIGGRAGSKSIKYRRLTPKELAENPDIRAMIKSTDDKCGHLNPKKKFPYRKQSIENF